MSLKGNIGDILYRLKYGFLNEGGAINAILLSVKEDRKESDDCICSQQKEIEEKTGRITELEDDFTIVNRTNGALTDRIKEVQEENERLRTNHSLTEKNLLSLQLTYFNQNKEVAKLKMEVQDLSRVRLGKAWLFESDGMYQCSMRTGGTCEFINKLELDIKRLKADLNLVLYGEVKGKAPVELTCTFVDYNLQVDEYNELVDERNKIAAEDEVLKLQVQLKSTMEKLDDSLKREQELKNSNRARFETIMKIETKNAIIEARVESLKEENAESLGRIRMIREATSSCYKVKR